MAFGLRKGVKLCLKAGCMKLYCRSIIISAVVGAYVACAPVEFVENESFVCNDLLDECTRVTPTGIDYEHRVSAPGKNVDILFVVDNSGSMSFEQNEIANRFNGFLAQLDGKEMNYHIAMTTTDISSSSNPSRSINKNGVLQDGKLLQLVDSNGNGTGQYIIKRDQSNREELFEKTIMRPETLACENWLNSFNSGSDPLTRVNEREAAIANCPSFDERGIVAAGKAVERNEHGFLRRNAHTAIVIISDEDERSVGADGVADSRYANAKYGIETEDRPEVFIEDFKYKFGVNKTLTVHSIIVKPGDVSCLNIQNAQTNGVKGFEGDFYEKLSNLTSGVVGDVCASNYTSQLEAIGSTIAQQTVSIAIHCSSPESLKVAFSPVENAVPYEVMDSKIVFDDALDANTSVTVSYSCKN